MKNWFSKLLTVTKEEDRAAFRVALFTALLIGSSTVFAIISRANVVGIVAQGTLVLIALIAVILSRRGQPVAGMALLITAALVLFIPAPFLIAGVGLLLGSLMAVMVSGIAITTSDLPFIFNRFYRVRSNETSEIEGNGLGLAIVKSVVEQHGGQISVESELGNGTCFSVSLPMLTI